MPKTRSTLLIAAAAASLALAASAQEPMMQPSPTTPKTTPPSPSGDPPAVPPEQGDTVDGVVRQTPPSVDPMPPQSPKATLKAGAEVKDPQGLVIGKVAGIGVGKDGPTVTLTIDGKPYTVPQSAVTQTGDAVVSSKTKAQIIAMNAPET